MTSFAIVIVCLGIVAGLTGASHPATSRTAKIAASSLVVVAAAVLTDMESTYAVMVFTALIASWVGDLALSFTGRRVFLMGLVAFAVAHLIYIAAFSGLDGFNRVTFAIGASAMAAVGVVVLRWLAPHRPPQLASAVAAYVVIIGVMVASAFSTIGGSAHLVIPIAALLFAGSDILVARQQFVARTRWNRMIGLPVYFLAQLLFVLSAM